MLQQPQLTFPEDTQTDVVIPRAKNRGRGNAIGLPGGAYGFQMEIARMLHKANGGMHGTIDPAHQPELAHTDPRVHIHGHPNWADPKNIVSFHARGHRAAIDNLNLVPDYWFLPTISVSQSYFGHPSIKNAMDAGRLRPDNKNLFADGTYVVTDINIDPVWHLDGLAERIGMDAYGFRDHLFKITNHRELIELPEIPYFLPPMDGPNIHVFGDISKLQDPSTPIAARSHDYCRDGDNYGLRCTCAPFKEFAIEEMLKLAIERDGVGLLVLYPEEGRNLGSVIKHLVYNRRETRPEGDTAALYMETTEDIAGGEDARMHWSKPDAYKWLLGPQARIDYWLSENPHKRDALQEQGIQIGEIVNLPEERIPERARVEINAKRGFAGYSGKVLPSIGHDAVTPA